MTRFAPWALYHWWFWYLRLNDFRQDWWYFASLANKSSPWTLPYKLLSPSYRARVSICFQVGSFSIPFLSLNTAKLMHRSVLRDTFTSSLLQKMHSGGNNCVAEEHDGLQCERDVKASFDDDFSRSWFLVKFLVAASVITNLFQICIN